MKQLNEEGIRDLRRRASVAAMFGDSCMHLLERSVSIRQIDSLSLRGELNMLLLGAGIAVAGLSRRLRADEPRLAVEFFGYDDGGFAVRIETELGVTGTPGLLVLEAMAGEVAIDGAMLVAKIQRYGVELLVSNWLLLNPKPPRVISVGSSE